MKKAIFIKELKGRFLCEVEINGNREQCYVSSSSHLSHFINLTNNPVLLKQNNGKDLRTKYTLYAVRKQNTYMLLNLNDLNNIFLQLLPPNKEIKKEYKINNYKTDYYIPKQKRIIEIKGIISESKMAVYNFKTHIRAYLQLKIIKELLLDGYKVDYAFVMLNPHINAFNLCDKRYKENRLFIDCIKLGMNVKFYKTVYKNNQFKIFEQKILKNF